jgi:transposase, IS5 family
LEGKVGQTSCLTEADKPIQKYGQLIGIAEEVVQSARKVLECTRKTHSRDLLTDRRIGELRKEIDQFCKLGDRVNDQASRRVLQGEQVPNEEKIFSIFEVHTDLIKRGKVLTPVEFGHKVSKCSRPKVPKG